MNIALWIVQVLLAFAFIMAGGTKLALPIEELLANGMTYVNHMPAALVRFIGVAEVAGALGLVVPALLKSKPGLTPLAAAALGVVMSLAVMTHLLLGEFGAIVPPVVLGSLATFVAWGRFKAEPIVATGSRDARETDAIAHA